MTNQRKTTQPAGAGSREGDTLPEHLLRAIDGHRGSEARVPASGRANFGPDPERGRAAPAAESNGSTPPPPMVEMQVRRDGPASPIELLKARYRRNEVSLEQYLHELAALRQSVLEEDIITDARLDEQSGDGAAEPIQADAVARLARGLPPRTEPAESLSDADASGPLPEPEGEPAMGATRTPPEPPPAPRSTPPATGTILGDRFLLEERLGEGGTGDVYRAQDLLEEGSFGNESIVAIKLLSPAVSRNPDLRRAILRAAAEARRLRHPNIGQIYELHRFGTTYAIVMEWLPGESLARRLDRDRPAGLPRNELQRVLTGVRAALGHAHAAGIVHGDLKPGNLFVTTDGQVKVLDFGFGGSWDAGAVTQRPTSTTPWGVTQIYASPEVLEGAPPTVADDLYALACTIYRCVSGTWAYGARDALDAERSHAKPMRPHGLTREQWQTLKSALAFRRADRKGTIDSLVAPFIATPKPRVGRSFATAAVLTALAVFVAYQGLERGWRLPDPEALRSTLPFGGAPTVGAPSAASPPATASTPGAVAIPATPRPELSAPDVPPSAATSPSIEPPIVYEGPEAASRSVTASPPAPSAQFEGPRVGAAGEAAASPSVPAPGAPLTAPEAAPTAPVTEPVTEPVTGPVTAASVPATSVPAPEASSATAVPETAAPVIPTPPPSPPPAPRGPMIVSFAGNTAPIVGESDGVVKLSLRGKGGGREPVILGVRAVGGSAREGRDFMPATPNRIEFTHQRRTAEVLVPLLSDSVNEGAEDFAVEFSIEAGNAEFGEHTDVVVIIVADDSPVVPRGEELLLP